MKRGLIIGVILAIIIGVILAIIIGTSFYNKDLNDIEVLDKIQNKKTYTNQEYQFKINYPKEWQYKEFPRKPVTSSFKVYNYTTEKYENKFVKGETEFVVAFGPNKNLMPTVFRGGDDYVMIEVYEETMEDLFNRTYERSGWVKHYIEIGKFNMTLENFRNDFFGEEIIVNNLKAYKITSEGQIPDALEKFPITEIRFEKDNNVINIIMENVDNIDEVNEIYEEMITTFEILD